MMDHIVFIHADIDLRWVDMDVEHVDIAHKTVDMDTNHVYVAPPP